MISGRIGDGTGGSRGRHAAAGRRTQCADGAVGSGRGATRSTLRSSTGAGTARALNIDCFELVGVLLKLGKRLQNDVVLIRLRIESADLPLSERVIKGRVDLVRRNVQPGRSGAIHVEMHADAIVLLIGGDVGHLRQLTQLRHHFCRPQIQLRDVGVLERVLVLRPADAIVDREVLNRLEIEVDPWNLINALLQTSYHFGCGEMALLDRLEIDLDTSAVQSGVGAVGSDEG